MWRAKNRALPQRLGVRAIDARTRDPAGAQPLPVELHLVHQAGLDLRPGLILAVRNIDLAGVDHTVAARILAELAQGIVILVDFRGAEIAGEAQVHLCAAFDRFWRHPAPQEFGTLQAHRFRTDQRIFEIEVLAGKAEALAGPGPLHDLDSFERPAEPLFDRHLQNFELFKTIADADSQPQAAVRDDVDQRGVLGQPQ